MGTVAYRFIYGRRSNTMIEEIRPNLFRNEIPLPNNPLKYVNSYVVRAADRSLIIDTGLNRAECLNAMEAGLRELELDLDKTDFFITHSHADHFALVSKLVRDTRKVYFNRPDKEFLQIPVRWDAMISYGTMNGFSEKELRAALLNHPGYKYGLERVPDMIFLEEGDKLQVGDYHFRCVRTPGHTWGHTCLYEPRKKILVSGDHILIDITPNIQCWSSQGNPLENYLASLDKVYELEVDLVLPGHRRLFTNHRERIEELKRHHRNRADEILVILKEGPKNAFQVAAEMTWDIQYDSWDQFPLQQKWFATGEAIAHLRYLEEKGGVFKRTKREMIRYSLDHA
jgi:glyoxylase-like metal-dependent hydrolase (beta-lactamase superfamily II)